MQIFNFEHMPVLAKDGWNYKKERKVYFAIELVGQANNPLYISKTDRLFNDNNIIGTISIHRNGAVQKSPLEFEEVGMFELHCDDSEENPMGRFAADLLNLYLKDKPCLDSKIVSLSTGRRYGKSELTTTVLLRFASLLEYQILEDYFDILYTGEYHRKFITSLGVKLK